MKIKLSERYIRLIELSDGLRFYPSQIEKIRELYPSFLEYIPTSKLADLISQSPGIFSKFVSEVKILTPFQFQTLISYPEYLNRIGEKFPKYLVPAERGEPAEPNRFKFTPEALRYVKSPLNFSGEFLTQEMVDILYLRGAFFVKYKPSEIVVPFQHKMNTHTRDYLKYISDPYKNSRPNTPIIVLPDDVFSVEECIRAEKIFFDSSDVFFAEMLKIIPSLDSYPYLPPEDFLIFTYFIEAIWKFHPYRTYSDQDLDRIMIMYDKGLYPFISYYQLIRDQPLIRRRLLDIYGDREPLSRCYGAITDRSHDPIGNELYWYNEKLGIILNGKMGKDLVPYSEFPVEFKNEIYFERPVNQHPTLKGTFQCHRLCYQIRQEILLSLQKKGLNLQGPRSVGEWIGTDFDYKFYIDGKVGIKISTDFPLMIHIDWIELRNLEEFFKEHRFIPEPENTDLLINHFDLSDYSELEKYTMKVTNKRLTIYDSLDGGYEYMFDDNMPNI